MPVAICLQMRQSNHFPKEQYPSTKDLAAAIKSLPTPGADVPVQRVRIDAGSDGHYIVTFVSRQNPEMPSWFWGIESSERINAWAPPEEPD